MKLIPLRHFNSMT